MDARRRANAAWRAFLESTPPNVPTKIDNLFGQYHPQSANNVWSLRLSEIELFCETDDGPRFFASASEYLFPERRTWEFVSFTCKNCGTRWKMFSLVIEHDEKNPSFGGVMKLGEFPPFGAPISKRIARLLGDADLELYRKGMRAEAQGLGIGAATYFRRIVDNQWKQLVAEIREARIVPD
jgi:hypothetical protein